MNDSEIRLRPAQADDLEALNRVVADAIATWCDALTADGDILIYGCDVASSAQGEQLIEALAELTGADLERALERWLAAIDDEIPDGGYVGVLASPSAAQAAAVLEARGERWVRQGICAIVYCC